MRQAGPVERVDGAAQKLLDTSGVADWQVADERDADRTRTGLDAHARYQASFDRVTGVLRVLEHHRQIGVAADRRQVDSLTINARLHLLRIVESTQVAEVRLLETNAELVLAVEREAMGHRESTDGSERQPLEVLVLRQVLTHAIGLGDSSARRIANGERADLRRG